jgi:shikimate dehydrogenase
LRIVLIGHPVGHSVSPAIHNAAFEFLGREERYEAIDVAPERLRSYLTMIREGFYAGANITVPHKVPSVALMDELDRDAEMVGAINTVVVRGGRLVGYNTDVHGAWEGLLGPVRDSLLASHILMLGAGGGARAVLAALSRSTQTRPREVVLMGRNRDITNATVAIGQGLGLNVRATRWGTLKDEAPQAGIYINCTPLGLGGEDPLADFPLNGKVVLDLVYRRGGTALFHRGWSEGAVALQGDDMLLHQAAAAFRLWTGTTAPIEVMRNALKSRMKA